MGTQEVEGQGPLIRLKTGKKGKILHRIRSCCCPTLRFPFFPDIRSLDRMHRPWGEWYSRFILVWEGNIRIIIFLKKIKTTLPRFNTYADGE